MAKTAPKKASFLNTFQAGAPFSFPLKTSENPQKTTCFLMKITGFLVLSGEGDKKIIGLECVKVN